MARDEPLRTPSETVAVAVVGLAVVPGPTVTLLGVTVNVTPDGMLLGVSATVAVAALLLLTVSVAVWV